jgi:murein DD-endopeptidase MepM/ murein hydrolase activator NlpD
MQEPKKQVSEPLVLHIRISGRWMPMLSAISVFALLPALSASAPLEEGAPLALSAKAGRSQAVDLATAAAMTVNTSAARLTDAVQAGAAGGGAIAFPGISLPLAPGTPGATGVVAASPFVRAPGFILPVVGPITSVFGPRQHPVLGVPMFHTGIDLSASCGTPVRAAADGTVAYAGVTPSWGQRVIIAHDTQLKTGYAHLSRLIAKEGQVVRQGDVIGLVGTTGWSTGCHLHFDVILNDRYVDPRPYLGLGPATSVSIPYTAAPHRVTDTRGSVVYTVEDGDVPIPVEVTSPTTQPPATSTPSTPTTSIPSTTTDPTTSTPTTTTDPTTSTPTTTSDPTTSTPTTTTDPTTSTPPTTTDPTTSTPPTTGDPTTTTPPTTDPTTAPTDATTTSAPPATTDPTTTSQPAPTTTSSEPAAVPTSAPTTSTAAADTTTSSSTSGSTSAPAAADTTSTDTTATPAS